MNYLRVKNWERFQQYKDREPKWIKLYRSLLNNYEFCQLSDASKGHLLGIWLLAAQTGNKIANDPSWIKAKIGAKSQVNVNELVTYEFLEPYEPVQNGTQSVESFGPNWYLEEEGEREEIREETDTTPNGVVCAEPADAETAPPDGSEILLTFPCKPGRRNQTREWGLTLGKTREWYALWGKDIDVLKELRKARQWTVDNPQKRKTHDGMLAFLSRWITRAIDHGDGSPPISKREARKQIERLRKARDADDEQAERARQASARQPDDGRPVDISTVLGDLEP